MPTQSQTTFDLKGIAAVLRDQRVSVPVYQRSFEWDGEVNELLDDLDGAFQRNEEYFLGTIVVISGDATTAPTLIDGQQRLASVALLLAGIAESFDNLGENERGGQTRTQYLMSYDIPSGQPTAHLRLNQLDEPYFRTLLESGFSNPTAEAPDSNARLHEARRLASDWLNQKVNESSEPITWLGNFLTFLTDTANVMVVKVPDDANGFLIFETLNDRGLDLSIADLLKNYILGRAQADLDVVLSHWNNAISALSAHGGDNLFTVFLRHYWSSKHNVVREKELYRNIKGRITSRPHVLDLALELDQNSYLYAAIISPDHEFWSEFSGDTREDLRTLQILGLEQYRPLLLAAMVHMEQPVLRRLVQLLISWNVRLLIVGGLGGGVMERHYSDLGQAIRRGDLRTAAQLSREARAFVPSDRAFRDAFRAARVSKALLARYYLRKIEEAKAGTAADEQVPNPNLTLEHIFPERPLGNWPEFTDQENQAYLRRIGNLTLLTERMNSAAKSWPFEQKKPIYAGSSLLITSELSRYDSWTPDTIEARQAELADLAVSVWRLS